MGPAYLLELADDSLLLSDDRSGVIYRIYFSDLTGISNLT